MLTSRVGDDGARDGLAIERDALHTLLGAVGMDGDLVFCLAELAVDGIVGGRLGQTGINADTIVVGLDAEDELRDGVPHPGGGTREPRVLALARLIGAIDYTQSGVVLRYSPSGELLDSFKVGINPGNFCWREAK